MPRTAISAFTVLELLTVITILAILAALLLPSLSAARRAADRTRTKARFAQWAAAAESFRREYGGYPEFHSSGLVNGGAAAGGVGDHLFHDLLAGRSRDGVRLTDENPAARQNRRHLAFHVFSDAELRSDGAICDASGQTSIAVLVDADLDGVIRIGGDHADYEALPPVLFSDGTAHAPPRGAGDFQFPANGLRAGVAFYAPAPESVSGSREFVVSWK